MFILRERLLRTDFPVYPNPGAFQTTLTGTDAGTSTAAFAAKLTLEPTLTLSPTTVSFGAVLEGTTSVSQAISVTNNTGTAVPYTLTVQGTNAADFAVVTGGYLRCGHFRRECDGLHSRPYFHA